MEQRTFAEIKPIFYHGEEESPYATDGVEPFLWHAESMYNSSDGFRRYPFIIFIGLLLGKWRPYDNSDIFIAYYLDHCSKETAQSLCKDVKDSYHGNISKEFEEFFKPWI